MSEKLADFLMTTAPQLAGLVWAIWYSGGKIDKLTSAIVDLRDDVKTLLHRGERLR